MGWNCSLAGGGPWKAGPIDLLMEGYEPSGEKTDFSSASTGDSPGMIALGVLPSGNVIMATQTECDAIGALACLLSDAGKAGEFHLGSNGVQYGYKLYENGGSTEERDSEDKEAQEEDDPDDSMGLLDEEDALVPADLDEDCILELFNQILGEADWSWEETLEMHYYKPVVS